MPECGTADLAAAGGICSVAMAYSANLGMWTAVFQYFTGCSVCPLPDTGWSNCNHVEHPFKKVPAKFRNASTAPFVLMARGNW